MRTRGYSEPLIEQLCYKKVVTCSQLEKTVQPEIPVGDLPAHSTQADISGHSIHIASPCLAAFINLKFARWGPPALPIRAKDFVRWGHILITY